jgi:hypothetical protein
MEKPDKSAASLIGLINAAIRHLEVTAVAGVQGIHAT